MPPQDDAMSVVQLQIKKIVDTFSPVETIEIPDYDARNSHVVRAQCTGIACGVILSNNTYHKNRIWNDNAMVYVLIE